MQYLAQTPTGAPFDWKAGLYNLVVSHPTAAVLVIVVLALAAAGGIVVFAAWKAGVGETIYKIATHKADEKTVTDRDAAREAQRHAEKLAEDILTEAELLRLALRTTATSVQAANNLPGEGVAREEEARRQRGFLCDWTTRVFAFSKQDINKVTAWTPTGRGTLRVLTYNGMAPGSADVLQPEIVPQDPQKDTFAAMAFRAGETQVCHDVDTDPRYHQLGRPPTHPYKSIIAAPMRRGGQVVGVLTVDSLFVGNFDTEQQKQLAELSASLFALYVPVPQPMPAKPTPGGGQ